MYVRIFLELERPDIHPNSESWLWQVYATEAWDVQHTFKNFFSEEIVEYGTCLGYFIILVKCTSIFCDSTVLEEPKFPF
jgi:hypothetical protein